MQRADEGYTAKERASKRGKAVQRAKERSRQEREVKGVTERSEERNRERGPESEKKVPIATWGRAGA